MNPTAIIPINHPLTDFITWNMSAESLKAADCGPAAALCYKCEHHCGRGSYTCINGAHSTCLHGENQVVHLRNYLSAGASQQITVSIYFSELQQEFRSTSSGRTILISVQWLNVKDRRCATPKVWGCPFLRNHENTPKTWNVQSWEAYKGKLFCSILLFFFLIS